MKMEWGRLILEESHQARNTTTAKFKSRILPQGKEALGDNKVCHFSAIAPTSIPFLSPCDTLCVDELFHRYFIKPKRDPMSSELLLLRFPNKVLVAAFQRLAIRRDKRR